MSRKYCFVFILILIPAVFAFAQEEAALPPGYLLRPLEDSGRTDAFAYNRAENLEGFYEVRLKGQEEAPVYMAESTLQLVLGSRVPVEVQAALISQYPHRMIDMYDHVINNYYPDDQESYVGNPFPGMEREGVTVTQDPYAPNYVRVRVTDEDGRVEEYSFSRRSFDEILEAGIEDGDFGKALQEFPYRLPEKARYSFNHLSRQDLVAMIEEVPSVANQEFVQVKRFYLNPPEDRAGEPVAMVEPVPAPEMEEEYVDVEVPPLAPPLRRTAELKEPAPSGPVVAEEPLPEEEQPPSRKPLVFIIVLLVCAVSAAFLVAKKFKQ